MESNSRIAIIQMRSVLDKRANLQRATDLIAEAVHQGSEFIVLPETFNLNSTLACTTNNINQTLLVILLRGTCVS